MAAQVPIKKTEEEWQAIPSPEQFRVLRQKGIEARGTGEYDKLYEEGLYNYAGCKTQLYKSSTKFNSACGWPTFYQGFEGAINRSPDLDGNRTEITCAACGGHLGHVFKYLQMKGILLIVFPSNFYVLLLIQPDHQGTLCFWIIRVPLISGFYQ